jgi:hypothetical protein
MIDLKLHRSMVRPLVAVSSALVGCAALLGSAPALAQDPAAMTASATTGSASSAGGTDHAEAVASKLAFGWMGVNTIPIGLGSYGTSAPGGLCGQLNVGQQQADLPCRPVLNGSTQVSAPTIGVRYWLNDGMGIDVGLGLGILSGSTKSYPYPSDVNSVDLEYKKDKASVLAFALHAGVPIVLGTPGRHYTFEVIPEANLGIASGTLKDQPQPPPNSANPTAVVLREDLKLGGFRLDVGARIGTEIQFGFIGLPKLALQATVGLYFSTQSVKVTAGGKDATDSSTSIGTSVQQAPWALFTNNIAALYYFLDPGPSPGPGEDFHDVSIHGEQAHDSVLGRGLGGGGLRRGRPWWRALQPLGSGPLRGQHQQQEQLDPAGHHQPRR